MLQTKVVDKIEIHILCSVIFFRKLCILWDNVEKRGTAGQATDDNITGCMRFACWIKRLRTYKQNMQKLLLFHGNMVTQKRLYIFDWRHPDVLKFNTKIIECLSSNTSCFIVVEATCFGPYTTIIRPIFE